MTAHSDDLISLDELRSVLGVYAGPAEPRRRPVGQWPRRFRPAIVVAVAVLAFVVAGVAIADGLGAFDGIRAAQHPRTGSDVIDPATWAAIEHGSMPIPIGLLFDTARRVGQLPTGQNVYVIARSGHDDNLCVIVGPSQPESTCHSTLSRKRPTTVLVDAQDLKNRIVFGVALDGVTAVSWEADGRNITVPVKDNLWAYTTEDWTALTGPQLSLTAHFADGTTVVDNCPMC
jgi:hypothetical protein